VNEYAVAREGQWRRVSNRTATRSGEPMVALLRDRGWITRSSRLAPAISALSFVADIPLCPAQYRLGSGGCSKFDLLILAGRYLDITSMVDIRAQIVVVRQYSEPVEGAKRVFSLLGHHDLECTEATPERKTARDLLPTPGGNPNDGDSLLSMTRSSTI